MNVASTGYVDESGVYHKKEVPLEELNRTRQSMFQQGDWARQRFDHAGELIQPHTVDGKPNPQFIEAFPAEAARYGFIPREEVPELMPDPLGPSATPNPGDKRFGGSTPWEYSLQQRQGNQ